MQGTRIAFLSDIHSNLEALESVTEHLEADKVAVLGDVVGYGPNPNEVLEWIRSNADAYVKGNHDHAVVTGETSWFNRIAAFAISWTRSRITPENLNFLKSLSTSMVWEVEGLRILLAHGSPLDPLYEYVYESSHSTLFDYYLERFEVNMIALGHTHLPFIWTSSSGMLLNPGSVGQPRDGDNRASYSIVEIVNGLPVATNYRVPYDFKKTAEKIGSSGLPEMLGTRLLEGW